MMIRNLPGLSRASAQGDQGEPKGSPRGAQGRAGADGDENGVRGLPTSNAGLGQGTSRISRPQAGYDVRSYTADSGGSDARQARPSHETHSILHTSREPCNPRAIKSCAVQNRTAVDDAIPPTAGVGRRGPSVGHGACAEPIRRVLRALSQDGPSFSRGVRCTPST